MAYVLLQLHVRFLSARAKPRPIDALECLSSLWAFQTLDLDVLLPLFQALAYLEKSWYYHELLSDMPLGYREDASLVPVLDFLEHKCLTLISAFG